MAEIGMNQRIERDRTVLLTDWLPSGMYALILLGISVCTFFLPVFFKEELGYNGAQIGILYAMQSVGGILAAFPAGWGNDKINSRTWVGLSLLVSAIAFVIMAGGPTFVLFTFVFFIWNLFYTLLRLSMDSQILKTDKGDRTGQRIGFYQAFRFGGLMIGAIAGGYVLDLADFRLTLYGVGALMMIMLLPAFWLPKTPISGSKLSEYKGDFTNPKVLLFAGWFFLFATHWGAEYTSYGLFLRENLGLTLTNMGWYMAVEFGAVMITVYVAGRHTKSPRALKVMTYLGLVTSGIGHMGMVWPNVVISAIFRGIHGAGDGLIFIVLYVGIAKLFKIERLGGNAGLLNLVSMIGMIAGALVCGPIGENFGYQVPLFWTGVMTLLLVLPLLTKGARRAMV